MAEYQEIPRRVHLVGIGGAGMSGLAQCLLSMNHEVSGSDLQRSAETSLLGSLGARISYEHSANNVARAELVVASDAIDASNVELDEARLCDIRIVKRAECLDLLGRPKKSVCVAGSHGKTTTSAMIAKVLDSAGVAPSYVIGATVPSLGNRRACIGAGVHFVAEACEAFQNLHLFHPDIAVITNIDNDHIDHYGSQTKLDEAFRGFASRAGPDGVVIASGDDEGVRRILPILGVPVTTFGFGSTNDVCAGIHEFDATCSRFDVLIKGHRAGTVHMPVPGRHATLNALACIATCYALGIGFSEIVSGLGAFTGVSRRWQDHGLIAGVRVVEDYAHHPTALKALIETARLIAGENRRLVIAFQPQLYSRTQRLYREFAEALSASDLVLQLEVDPSGERDSGVRSHLISDELNKHDTVVESFGDVDDFVDRAPSFLDSGDFLLIAGAGSIRSAIERLPARLSAPSAVRRALTFTPQQPAADNHIFDATAIGFEADHENQNSVISKFRSRAAGSPACYAVSARHRRMSYGELDATSDALTTVFQARGFSRGTVVGVSLPPSIDLIVVMLGLMKTGAVYLPLDVNLPTERVSFMLSAAGGTSMITSSGLGLGAEAAGITIITLGDLQRELDNLLRDSKTSSSPDPEDTAYICFTSGSTGYPRGVAITHHSLLSLISATAERFGIGRGAKMALNTSISFDVSLAEVWMTLCGGGELVAAAASRPLIGERLAEFIENSEITHIAITPAVLASVRPRPLPSLACIICAGEACPSELVDRWAGGRRFFNAYGPTEATIYATVAECGPGKTVTIGKALDHVDTYVVDPQLNLLPPGEIGELCLGGAGVAKGYIGLDEESRDKFVTLSREGSEMGRFYRTGDLVKLDRSGNFLFLGRLDNQIKILGNRVELEEIEHAIKRIDGIAEAAVCVDESTGKKELVCFAVFNDHPISDWTTISERLSAWLPGYMLPSRFVRVQSIPLTSSGKKDRRALVAKHRAQIVSRAEYAPPRNDVEARLISIWKDILEIEGDIGVFDNFASLGGDSLKTLLLIDEVEQKFGAVSPPGYFGRITTIPRMAVQVADLLWREDRPRTDAAFGFLASRIYSQLRNLTADWTGARVREGGLIISCGGKAAVYDLFLCVQYEFELRSLFKHLGEEFRLHGMRSGHLVMDYSRDNIEQLCSHYVEELKQISPRGKLVIGGVCQGGVIAHAMACMLQKAGLGVSPLILVEQVKLLPFGGNTAFYYAEDSFLNPFKRFESGLSRYDAMYGARYTVDILVGEHGSLFDEPNVQFLAQRLRSRICVDNA